jgi:hypothetical protein
MADHATADARRAMGRLRRALEKAEHEMDALAGALRHAEGKDFPAAEFDDAQAAFASIISFIDEQEQRIADKILHAGGLEPGRVRRSE